MQADAAVLHRATRAVLHIAHDAMAPRRQLSAYLMEGATFWHALHQRVTIALGKQA